MDSAISTWIERLGDKPLPLIAHTARHVLDMLKDPQADFLAMGRALQHDPGLSLELFRSAGTILDQRQQDPCATPGLAISLLGKAKLEQITSSLPLLGDFDNLATAYSQAIHAAHYAQRWAETRGDANADQVGTAALFQQLAEFALWAHAPDKAREIRERVLAGEHEDRVEQDVLGCTLDELNQALARRWFLPILTQRSLDPMNNNQARPFGAMLASALSLAIDDGWAHPNTRYLIEQSADYLGRKPDTARAMLHRWAAEVARKLHGNGLPLPIYRLLSDPEASASKAREAKPKADLGKVPFASAKKVDRSPPRTLRHRRLETPPQAASNGGLLHNSVNQCIEDMRTSAGLKRVMFAMLTPDRSQLRARFVLDDSQDESFRQFSVATAQKNLFSMLLAKPQAIWVNADNKAKFSPMLPQPIANGGNRDGFFSMSLFVKNRSIGVFYGDAGPDGRLDNESYARFKQLCQRVANTLAGAA